MEFFLGMEEELTTSLWVRFKGGQGQVTLLESAVGCLARKPFCKQTGAASQKQTLVLLGASTTPISAGGTAEQSISDAGVSWITLINSFSK